MKGSAGELPFGTLDSLAHVPLDDALDALGHVQRRRLLFALLDSSPRGSSPAVLADPVETDTLEHLGSMSRVHLPKLAEYGFIDWNRDAHEVTEGSNFDEIRPLLELLADHGDELSADWF